MGRCPLCYKSMKGRSCKPCNLELTQLQLLQLKADTYDDIVDHLISSEAKENRKREKARCKIAMRNIAKWAKENRTIMSAMRYERVEE